MSKHIAENPELIEVYLFTSMPLSLYRQFRSHPIIRKLAKTYKANELAAMYNRVAKLTEKTVPEVVLSYAYLIALGLRSPQENRPYLENIDKYNLDWVEYIARYMLENPEPAVISDYQVTTTTTELVSARPSVQTRQWVSHPSRLRVELAMAC